LRESGGSHHLQAASVNIRIKLAALWTSVMFCYIYADYFGLYVPGALQHMLEGRMAPLGHVNQGMLVGTSLMLAIPGVMICLSVLLRPGLCRTLNIVFGVLYTLIILVTMWGWAFYIVYGVIEITLTVLVVAFAWRWPRTEATGGESLP
jgi:hypothetical protein